MALPAVLLPAATLWLAYRSAERQMQERDRFQHLYEVGQAFASSLVLEEVLPNVLPKVARLFGAEEAHLLFAQGAGRPFGAIHGPDGFRFGPADPADLAALALLGEGTGPVVGRPGQAPDGWRELLVAPLVAQGRHLGVIVLGNLRRDRHAEAGAGMRLGRQDLQLLSPLASGLAVTLGNATQVAQIKEEKSTLEQILGLSSDGILLLDGKGRVRVWNQAMERITGVPADDAVGLPYNELLAGLDHDGKLVRLEDLLAAATPAGPRASAEVQIRTSEGLERWLRCNHSLLYEGGEWTTDVVIVHDVTRIRQAERAKTDFVATVSHELRTPITPIKGYVEILQARGPNLSEDKRQDMLRIVAERADHLARLVEDLLLASRISSEPGGSAVVGMQRECTDLAEAARRAAADWLRGPESRLELELPPGPLEVDADPLRLVQVLANLISNAHKYSPTDQEVRLRVWRDNGWAMAAVADRGRGIPREELDRVFEKFHRVEDPMTMTTGGTGLGLYIARELTRAMGGEIEATSAPRRGSTFTVRLPMARSREGGEDAGTGGRDRGDDTQPPGDQGTAGPRPPLPLLLALSLPGAVVHNPRVDRAGGERGATAVAYAVMVAILALLLVGGVMVLSGSVGTALTDTGPSAWPTRAAAAAAAGGGERRGRRGRRRQAAGHDHHPARGRPRRPPAPERGRRLLAGQAAEAGRGHLLEALQPGRQQLGPLVGQPVGAAAVVGRQGLDQPLVLEPGQGAVQGARAERAPPRTAGCPWSWRSRAWGRRPGSTSPATTGR